MAVNLSPVGGVAAQFFDNDGNVLSGGKIYTYIAGSSTPAVTYTNAAGVIQHSNPIILNSAGRVPSGEIWLTSGIQYKFVINNANNELIGTYDNITGINSNFLNFLAEQEIQTATAGQTVFTLTTTQYQPGTNTLSVYVDGVNQYGPGAQYAYTETSSTVVTFTNGLHVGASVKFTTTQALSGGAIDSSLVTYDPPFTGSVPSNVETKLSEFVSAADFGAVGDGVTDDTAALQAAIDYCIGSPGSKKPTPLLLTGKYLITSSLNIDMPVGAIYDINGFFLIQGQGAGAGIYVNSEINMFSTTLTGTPSNPPAKNIQFENVTFQASSNTLANAYVLDDVFINMRFISCTFQKIKCLLSSSQIFLYLFQNCNMLSWKGAWFSSYVSTNGPTTIKFLENWFFDGDTGIYMGLGCPSFVCSNNTFEGLQYSPIQIDGGYGGVISGNHFENNCLTGDKCNINVYCNGPISAYGMMIAGNYFSPTTPQRTDPTYYDIDARFAQGLSVQGNFTNGEQLINTASSPFGAVILGGNVQGAVTNIPVGSATFTAIKSPSAEFTQLQTNSQYSYGYFLTNNSVNSFTLATSGAVIIVSGTGTTGNCGVISVYPNAVSAQAASISSQANIAVTTGVLTGTTGTVGKLTVSAATDGKIYVENRTGGSLNVQIQVLAAG
jgi:hypothetical protein